MTPTLILVNPQMGENIGAAARAMMNFGLRELRLVAPRDGWPNPAAEAMAAHGAPIIQQAKVFPTLREAVADLHYVYASTARDRRLRKPQLGPRESAEEMAQRAGEGQRIGILFGPERAGLDNEDLTHAHSILTIPTDPENSSLNIAQSAVVICYEWWLAAQNTKIGFAGSEEPASHQPAKRCSMEKSEDFPGNEQSDLLAKQEEIHGFFDHLEAALDQTYFFKLTHKKERMWRNLRATFLRTPLSSQEVHTLRGVVAALEKGDKRK